SSTAVCRNRIAQSLRKRIDQAALYTIAANNKLAPALFGVALLVGKTQGHQLNLRARVLRLKMLAPGYVEPTVGAAQRHHGNPLFLQPGQPRAIGTKLRPTAAAQRQYGGACTRPNFACRGAKREKALVIPAQPAMTK